MRLETKRKLMKAQQRKLLAVAVAASSAIGCANVGDRLSMILFPARPGSWERKGESVEVWLVCKEPAATVKKPTEGEEKAFAAGPAIAMAAEIAIEAAVEFLRQESERYTASYSGVAVGDAFYAGDSVNLERIEMKRLLQQDIPSLQAEKDEAPGAGRTCNAFEVAPKEREGELAMKLVLDVLPTRDGTAIAILPSELVIHQSKAKIHLFNWLEPWTWIPFTQLGASDNDLDVVVKVVLHAAWVDKDGKGMFEKRGEGEFKIRNVDLGKTYTRDGSGDSRLPAGSLEGLLIPAIPRSVIGGQPRGLGNFVVSILVTEVDDYGSKIKEQADRLEKEREGLLERVRSFAE